VAQADPRFSVDTPEAHAGDAVQFTISNVDDEVTYVVEVEDRVVASGTTPDDEGVSGGFTMPDLGSKARSVTVEAQMTEDGDRDTVKRRIEYLGPAPAPEPAAAAPAAPSVPAAPPPPAGPAHAPAVVTPAGAPSSAAPREETTRRAARKRHARQRARKRTRKGAPVPSATARRAKQPRRRKSGGARVPRSRVLHDAPLFRGVPEEPGGSSADAGASGPSSKGSATAAAPPHVRAAPASATDSPWPKPTDAVPLALAMVALLLAGIVVARRRRLGADPDRDGQAGT
jgi:hypothetical protein